MAPGSTAWWSTRARRGRADATDRPSRSDGIADWRRARSSRRAMIESPHGDDRGAHAWRCARPASRADGGGRRQRQTPSRMERRAATAPGNSHINNHASRPGPISLNSVRNGITIRPLTTLMKMIMRAMMRRVIDGGVGVSTSARGASLTIETMNDRGGTHRDPQPRRRRRVEPLALMVREQRLEHAGHRALVEPAPDESQQRVGVVRAHLPSSPFLWFGMPRDTSARRPATPRARATRIRWVDTNGAASRSRRRAALPGAIPGSPCPASVRA